jgi:hypothetical protein
LRIFIHVSAARIIISKLNWNQRENSMRKVV